MHLHAVAELDELQQIEAVAARHVATFGSEPLNVSHWDPSAPFAAKLAGALELDHRGDPLAYIYSYGLDCRETLLRRLGFNPERKGCLITPSGTVSMLCAVNWLAARRREKLSILSPFYFPVLHQARQLGLSVNKQFMQRRDGRYQLPADPGWTSAPPHEVVWLTAPVYCTGTPLAEHDRQRLREFLERGGTVVADECLARSGTELGRELGEYPGFIGIYSPHKSVCLNALKFSAVVFDREHETFFDQWADVLYGGLSLSIMVAIRHFLSDNFRLYAERFFEEVRLALAFVKQMAERCPKGEFDHDPAGHFVTFYLPHLAAAAGKDEDFLWNLCRSSSTIVIPGLRNHFDPAVGFCFRINLALDGPQFRGGIGRLFSFLGTV